MHETASPSLPLHLLQKYIYMRIPLNVHQFVLYIGKDLFRHGTSVFCSALYNQGNGNTWRFYYGGIPSPIKRSLWWCARADKEYIDFVSKKINKKIFTGFNFLRWIQNSIHNDYVNKKNVFVILLYWRKGKKKEFYFLMLQFTSSLKYHCTFKKKYSHFERN